MLFSDLRWWLLVGVLLLCMCGMHVFLGWLRGVGGEAVVMVFLIRRAL